MGDGVKGRPFGRMAHVHDHADAVHLGHHGAAHPGQARIVFLIAAGRQQGLVVVGQLHEPQAKPVQDLDKADVVLDATGVLRAEKDGGPACGAGKGNILRGKALKDQVGEAFELAVPAFDVGTVSRKVS